jgi:hypothetical protein
MPVTTAAIAAMREREGRNGKIRCFALIDAFLSIKKCNL